MQVQALIRELVSLAAQCCKTKQNKTKQKKKGLIKVCCVCVCVCVCITESFAVRQKLSQHYKSTTLQLKCSMTEERKDCYISL